MTMSYFNDDGWVPYAEHVSEDEASYCWRIQAGQVHVHRIDGSLTLPLPRYPLTPEQPTQALEGNEHQGFDWTLKAVYEAVTRIAPHFDWYFAPVFTSTLGYIWGQTWYEPKAILVRSSRDPRNIVRTALHEAWHATECVLTQAELDAVADAVSRGPEWPADHEWGGHHSEQSERRAQAFEHWSMAIIEAPLNARTGTIGKLLELLHRSIMPAHERVFRDVFAGRVSARAAKRMIADTVRRSELARASDRRGLVDRAVDGWLSLSNAVFG